MKYLVINFPEPSTRGLPAVSHVDARFPQDAAEMVGVVPGGHCIVVTEGRRFDRPPEAPLDERALDGNPLPSSSDA